MNIDSNTNYNREYLLKRNKETNILLIDFKKYIWKPIKVICKVLFMPGMIAFYILVGFAFLMIGVNNAAHPHGEYELTYRVHYSNGYYKDYKVKHDREIQVGSHQGENYVKKYPSTYVISTTAPIEVIKYVRIIRPSENNGNK